MLRFERKYHAVVDVVEAVPWCDASRLERELRVVKRVSRGLIIHRHYCDATQNEWFTSSMEEE